MAVSIAFIDKLSHKQVSLSLTFFSPQIMEEFAEIVSCHLGHWSAIDGVNIEFLLIATVFESD